MANKSKSRQAALSGMLQAAWETILDLEADYQVRIEQQWTVSGRKGVFLIILSAYSEHPLDKGAKLSSYGFYYPNASAQPFETQLFRAVNELGILLASRPIPYRPS